MKLLSLLLVSSLTTIVVPSVNLAADTAQDVGPEIIRLKMGGIYLPFKHRKHQKLTGVECSSCHTPQEWKIEKWDKEVAHHMCIFCHDMHKKGPVVCKDCHSTTYTSIQNDQQ